MNMHCAQCESLSICSAGVLGKLQCGGGLLPTWFPHMADGGYWLVSWLPLSNRGSSPNGSLYRTSCALPLPYLKQ